MTARVDDWLKTTNCHLDLEDSSVMPYHTAVAAIALDLVRGRENDWRLVDVGCGLGQTLRLVAEEMPGCECHAIDESDACLKSVQVAVPHAAAWKRNLATDALPLLDDGKANVAISSHVLEHLRDPVRHVEQLIALAGPRGAVILAVPNPSRPSALVSALRRRNYANRGHIYSWDRAHLMVFLRYHCGLHDFDIVGDELRLFPRCLRRLRLTRRVESWLQNRLPWFTVSHIAVINAGAASLAPPGADLSAGRPQPDLGRLR